MMREKEETYGRHQGKRNIREGESLVSGAKHLKTFSDRLSGYIAALEKNNIEFNESFIYEGNLSIESGKAAVDYFFNLPVIPDAVFAVEDFTALGVMKGLKERKINVPSAFGVIGFANESFGEHISPSLSSVDQQTVQMGKDAFGLLMDMINFKNGELEIGVKEKIILEPVLFFRESSAGKING